MTDTPSETADEDRGFASRVADAITDIVKTSVRSTGGAGEALFALWSACSGLFLAYPEGGKVMERAQAFVGENPELLRSLTKAAIARACTRRLLSNEELETVVARAIALLNSAQTMPFETLLSLHMATRICTAVYKRSATAEDDEKLEASLRALDDIPTEVAGLEIRHMQKGGDA